VEKSRAHIGPISQFFGSEKQVELLAAAAPAPHMATGHSGSKTMTGAGRRDLKQCPRCRTTMFLDQVMAKFGPLPETRRYRCPECHVVVEEEIDRDGHPLSAIRFVGLADWLGIRRVVS
jgi:hypothetical protein